MNDGCGSAIEKSEYIYLLQQKARGVYVDGEVNLWLYVQNANLRELRQ